MVVCKMRLRVQNALLHKLGFVQPPYFYTSWCTHARQGSTLIVVRTSVSRLACAAALRDFSIVRLTSYKHVILHAITVFNGCFSVYLTMTTAARFSATLKTFPDSVVRTPFVKFCVVFTVTVQRRAFGH